MPNLAALPERTRSDIPARSGPPALEPGAWRPIAASAHSARTQDIVQLAHVDAKRGLSETEAAARLARFGPNALPERGRRSVFAILASQFMSLLVALLVAAALLSFLMGQTLEAVAIFVVVLINAAIGFLTEYRALHSMEALRQLSLGKARLRRDGHERLVLSTELVPGDIVLLEAGDVVPADLRLLKTVNLECDEAALTGESLPVAKAPEPIADTAILAERPCMVYKGTSTTRGSATGLVVATGPDSELGRISALAGAAEKEVTPLQRRLARLSRQLIWITLAVAALILAAGIAQGQPPVLMLKTAIALAVAAVPEGLPIVATMALARGMWRMAHLNVLIERLPAVETLGATTVICTDKTGTLTENRMTVGRIGLADDDIEFDTAPLEAQRGNPLLRQALEIGVLCNDAVLEETETNQKKPRGDPMEIALLAAAKPFGLDRAGLQTTLPRVRTHAFEAYTKAMATVHRTASGYVFGVKGAIETLLPACTAAQTATGPIPLSQQARDNWMARAEDLASRGVRVLAIARKETGDAEAEPYEDLTLVGIVGFLDPPRADVLDAIAACKNAGMRVVMVTGDHVATASAIAEKVGLKETEAGDDVVRDGAQLLPPNELSPEVRSALLRADVFGRVAPEQKLNLIALYQSEGEIVAMTGDGVNDAPALRKADIGVAMGIRGTQVAREAADMILRDDAFASIVAAVREGRVIFTNIRKFVVYLMSCNLSEIMIVGVAAAAGLPLPLLPLQILFLNLITDVFPAFALGACEGDARVMARPPRNPAEHMIAGRHWRTIVLFGAMLTLATLAAFLAALFVLDLPATDATTCAFLTLAFSQLVHVFNIRRPSAGLFINSVTRNPWIWRALIFCTLIILAAVYLPPLQAVFALSPPDGRTWALILAASAAPLVVPHAFFLMGRWIGWRKRTPRDLRAV